MRKFITPLLLGSALALGGCAGYGGMGGPLETVLGSVLGGQAGSGYGYGNQGFSQAAVNACAQYASRYGQVGISNVRQQSSSTLRVSGVVNNGYRQDDFACSYRSDGRITDFDI